MKIPTVLIADDSLFMRRILKDILEANGFQVVAQAGTADDAVARHAETNPDLTTMDITMDSDKPLSGFEAISTIRERCPGAAFVVITALKQQAVHQRAQAAGIAECLTKPFDDVQVVAACRRAVKSTV